MNKHLHTLRKKYCSFEITFTVAKDDFFVDINLIRLKTAKVIRRHYILRADVPQWVGMYEASGFVKLKN